MKYIYNMLYPSYNLNLNHTSCDENKILALKGQTLSIAMLQMVLQYLFIFDPKIANNKYLKYKTNFINRNISFMGNSIYILTASKDLKGNFIEMSSNYLLNSPLFLN